MPSRSRDTSTIELFPDLATPDQVADELIKIRPLRHSIWSHHKAQLIQRYLYFFVMVTRHGTYIDGFAGQQDPDNLESWSAKRVLESRPRYLRHFYLCELDAAKIPALERLRDEQPPRGKGESKRTVAVLHGDFNVRVDEILADGVITEKEAAFALLDQRTFECHWATVRKLAAHKQSGNKIELFYFLAVKWLHRSLAGMTVNEHVATTWWGNEDWRELKALSQKDIKERMTRRFRDELGYRHALAWPICDRDDGEGCVMYYMIHASDHDEAPGLMWRAFNQAIATPPPEQHALALELPDVDGDVLAEPRD
jgi:three-Cys-motif partner protein